ncbi:MAG TPA: hypothetical protein DEO38_01825 [Bacteroidales bacterium]|nr:hypothetical protein [Bacteroidales bacterium]
MLKSLLSSIGVSSFERSAADLFRHYAEQWADTVRQDYFGNTVATMNTGAKYRVLLSAHIDEVGFQVTEVCQNGLLKVRGIGGVCPARLNTQQVVVCADCGYVNGVMVSTPMTNDGKMPDIKDFFVDIDCQNREQAMQLIELGAPVAFMPNYSVHDSVITSKSIDDRVGCYVVLEVMKRLKGRLKKIRLSVAATTQEEIGLRGMAAVAQTEQPDMAINVDVTDAEQLDKTSRPRMGEGCAIVLNADSHAMFRERVIKTASRANIALQKCLGREITGGSDSSRMQIFSPKTLVGELVIPCKYMHSHTEKCSLNDIESCINIITDLLTGLDEELA